MAPTDLLPRERWLWWEQLWSDVIALAERYRIAPAKDWWENGVQVEALAALAAWVARYDSGEWDDPPGKLALLYDLERVRRADPAATSRFTPTATGRVLPLPDRRRLPAAAGRRQSGPWHRQRKPHRIGDP